MKRSALIAAALATTAILPTAAAALEAQAITDLNIRSGPGVDFDVVGVIDAEAMATVNGCLETMNWCEVEYDGITGWSYGEYLNVAAAAEVEAEVLALTAPDLNVEVETLTFQRDATDGEQLAGAAAGATLGGLIAYAAGGPVGGIIASSIFGSAVGAEASAEVEESITYVRQNPVEPIFLEGEVVVGAGVPAEVELFTLPTIEGYQYAYINGVPVIIETENRVIVEVVR